MKNKAGLFIPILIIALGLGWLLNVLNLLPSVNWLWTAGLGVAGILVIAVYGWNQLSVVVGPVLILGSILSVMRQTGRLSIDVELPLLLIASGITLLIGRLLNLPLPAYLQPTEQSKDNDR